MLNLLMYTISRESLLRNLNFPAKIFCSLILEDNCKTVHKQPGFYPIAVPYFSFLRKAVISRREVKNAHWGPQFLRAGNSDCCSICKERESYNIIICRTNPYPQSRTEAIVSWGTSSSNTSDTTPLLLVDSHELATPNNRQKVGPHFGVGPRFLWTEM